MAFLVLRDGSERFSETVSFRLPESLYSVLAGMARHERRKLSEILVAVVERGVAAYLLDGHLFEPQRLSEEERMELVGKFSIKKTA